MEDPRFRRRDSRQQYGTLTGEAVGATFTWHEQAQGKQIDTHADVYALRRPHTGV
jgi:hypothetical protein